MQHFGSIVVLSEPVGAAKGARAVRPTRRVMEGACGWTFWDFETEQYLSYGPTGEYLRLYGAQPSDVPGGPFASLHEHNGEPVLLGRDGDDAHRSIARPQEHQKMKVVRVEREGFASPQERVLYSGEQVAESWMEDACDRYTPKALEVSVPSGDGYAKFKAEFYWLSIGRTCGAQPWKLWMSLPWLMDSLANDGCGVFRRIVSWRSFLGAHEWPTTLIWDSSRSFKRKAEAMEDVPSSAALSQADKSTPDFCIAIPGLLLLLLKMIDDKRFRRKGDNTFFSEDDAKNLLRAFLDVVLKGKRLRMNSTMPTVVDNGIVDEVSVKSTQEKLFNDKRSRNVGNQYYHDTT